MRRFLTFTYNETYPSGGWNDFTGDYVTLEQALQSREGARSGVAQYFQVVDTFDGTCTQWILDSDRKWQLCSG